MTRGGEMEEGEAISGPLPLGLARERERERLSRFWSSKRLLGEGIVIREIGGIRITGYLGHRSIRDILLGNRLGIKRSRGLFFEVGVRARNQPSHLELHSKCILAQSLSK